MDEILEMIRELYADELQNIMRSIEQRYKEAYPEWDVIYVAVHKDPKLRRMDLEHIIELLRER